MRGHVFIVNDKTLPKHLEYMFVGTSAGERENNISLLADMMRVKGGDFIFFYIEGNQRVKGRFFGVFRALDNVVYHVRGRGAREPSLPIPLIYRKRISPYEVYQNGVLEWVALDKLPTYSKEILWTLIYRKMKAKRGNTMLFPWETERLINLIRAENQGRALNGNNFSFDSQNYIIIQGERTINQYMGNPINLDWEDIKKSEKHFQAFILQNLQIENNNFYPEIFGKNIVWIGNEVFAGSGMQKIDIMTIERINETSYLFRIIELKHPKSISGISSSVSQLEYYINWAREDIGGHVRGAYRFNIKPILLVLTKNFGIVQRDIINKIRELGNISFEPEVWEINFEGQGRRKV